MFTLAAICAGDAEESERIFAPLRELGEPVVDLSGQMPYCAVQRLFDAVIPFGQHRSYWKSLYIDALPDALIDEIVAWVGKAPAEVSIVSARGSLDFAGGRFEHPKAAGATRRDIEPCLAATGDWPQVPALLRARARMETIQTPFSE